MNKRKRTEELDAPVKVDEDHPTKVIPEICKLGYDRGWGLTGTGGGMSLQRYFYELH